MKKEEIIRLLNLKPLPEEGGLYVESYRSPDEIKVGERYKGNSRHRSTAIYYMLTPGQTSIPHVLPGDELYHFYLGDPVELLLLRQDGSFDQIILGQNLSMDQRVQFLVPGGVIQGSRLVPGGKFALMGTTMSPGFDFQDFQAPSADSLIHRYPDASELIQELYP